MNSKLIVNVDNTIILKDIPSGSGVEILGDDLYLMGDDSPVLFKLSMPDYKVIDKIYLLQISESRISKADKPDFEALTSTKNGDSVQLFLFGSGGISPQRDSMLIVDPEYPQKIKRYSLNAFYGGIIKANSLLREELNIEAAVGIRDKLYLLNRGKNIIIETDWNDFMKALETGSVPAFRSYLVRLPEINGIEAGFSGAGVVPGTGTFVFTASVENVPAGESGAKNWVKDGEILGSFAGIIDVSMLPLKNTPPSALLTDSSGTALKQKIESISVSRQRDKTISAIAVADNDDGSSTIFELRLNPEN